MGFGKISEIANFGFFIRFYSGLNGVYLLRGDQITWILHMHYKQPPIYPLLSVRWCSRTFDSFFLNFENGGNSSNFQDIPSSLFFLFKKVSVFYCGIDFSAWPIFSRPFTLVNKADSFSHFVRPKELSTFPQLFSLAYCFEPCRNILKLQKGPSLHFFPVIRKVLNISVVPPPMVYRKTTDKTRDTTPS